MAATKTAVSKTTSRSGGPTLVPRRNKNGKLRTGEKLAKRVRVTSNPFTWIAYSWHSYHNFWKRYRAVRHWVSSARQEMEDWSHDKGERMHKNKVRRHNSRQESKYRRLGYHECVGCETDAQGNPISTWHKPHEVVRHMDEKHGTGTQPQVAGQQKSTAPKPARARKNNSTKAAAAGGAAMGAAVAAAVTGKTSGPATPSNKGKQQAPAASGNQKGQNGGRQQQTGQVVTGPWKWSGLGSNSAQSTAWRRGMAGLDGVTEAFSAWAAAPAESWEQERAEADHVSEVFRGIADAFRRRAEVMVDQLKLDPSTVEPYDDAANQVSGIGDLAAEVVSRIDARYAQHREDIERGHFGEETTAFFKQ